MEDAFSPWRQAAAPLPLKFVIYIPLGDGGKERNSQGRSMVKEVQAVLCSRFGGVTSYPAVGMFKRASGVPEEERVQVLECFCEQEAWEEQQLFLYRMAGLIGALLKQESIACQVNGRMHLIDPDPAAAGHEDGRPGEGWLERMVEASAGS